MKTPLEQLEKYEMEHIMRTLEDDRKYNETVFDREAMRDIAKRNKNPASVDDDDVESNASPILDLDKVKKPVFTQATSSKKIYG